MPTNLTNINFFKKIILNSTPLHYAIQYTNEFILKKLVRHKADFTIPNNEQKAPFSLLMNRNGKIIAEWLSDDYKQTLIHATLSDLMRITEIQRNGLKEKKALLNSQFKYNQDLQNTHEALNSIASNLEQELAKRGEEIKNTRELLTDIENHRGSKSFLETPQVNYDVITSSENFFVSRDHFLNIYDELEAVRMTLNNQTKEFENVKGQLKITESEISKKQLEIKLLREEISVLRNLQERQSETKSISVKNMMDNFSNSQKSSKSAASSKSAVSSNLDLEKSFRQLETEYEILKKKLSSVGAENRQLQKKLQKSESQKTKFENKIEAYETQIFDTYESSSNYKKFSFEICETFKEILNKSNINEFTQFQEDLDEKVQNLKKKEIKIKELNSELDSLLDEQDILKDMLLEAEKTGFEPKDEGLLVICQEQIESSVCNFLKLQSERATYKDEINEIYIKTLNELSKVYINPRNPVNDTLAFTVEEFKALESTISEKEMDIKRLRTELESVSYDRKNLQLELKIIQKENDELEKLKNSDFDNNLKSSNDSNILKSENSRLANEISEWNDIFNLDLNSELKDNNGNPIKIIEHLADIFCEKFPEMLERKHGNNLIKKSRINGVNHNCTKTLEKRLDMEINFKIQELELVKKSNGSDSINNSKNTNEQLQNKNENPKKNTTNLTSENQKLQKKLQRLLEQKLKNEIRTHSFETQILTYFESKNFFLLKDDFKNPNPIKLFFEIDNDLKNLLKYSDTNEIPRMHDTLDEYYQNLKESENRIEETKTEINLLMSERKVLKNMFSEAEKTGFELRNESQLTICEENIENSIEKCLKLQLERSKHLCQIIRLNVSLLTNICRFFVNLLENTQRITQQSGQSAEIIKSPFNFSINTLESKSAFPTISQECLSIKSSVIDFETLKRQIKRDAMNAIIRCILWYS
ncbi:hypothetical protein HK096_004861, partial [Nowakowskiella sp. JEL0078]